MDWLIGGRAKLIAGAVAMLALVGVLGFIVAAAYRAGHSAASTSAEARETRAALVRARAALASTQAALQQQAAHAQADGAAQAALQGRLASQAATATALKERIRHVPLLVAQLPVCTTHPQRSEESPPEAVASGATGSGPAADDLAGRAPGADAAGLTRAAVGLWNAALFVGEPDAAELAADPCAAAAATNQACAPHVAGRPAGVSLDDAWANHITNAALCAADRARFAELIVAVQRRQSSAPPAQAAAATEAAP